MIAWLKGLFVGRPAPPAACPRCKGSRAQRLGAQEKPDLFGGARKTGVVWGCLDCRLGYVVDAEGVRAVGGWQPPSPPKDQAPLPRPPQIHDRDYAWTPEER
jgi:hypothetical protein